MFNPAITALTAPPVSVVQDWRASYAGQLGPLIDMSQAVPGYDAHPDMTAAPMQNISAKSMVHVWRLMKPISLPGVIRLLSRPLWLSPVMGMIS